MRAIATLFLALLPLNLSAAVIERLDPSALEANTPQRVITIYGTGLAGPVVFSDATGDYAVDATSGDGQSLQVAVPIDLMVAPGDVKVTVGDASAILKIIDSSPGPLQLQGGDPVVVPAEGRWGARVEYEVWAIGGRDPNPTVTCDPPSGSVFPLGPSNVRCVATNSFGERAEGGKYIFVADYGVPVVQVPDRIRVEATSPAGAYVEYTVTATDTIDGDLQVSCEPKSGSLFPIGETTVDCVAYDSSLNPGRGEFIVEVVEGPREELLLRLPDPIVAEATEPGGATVEFTVTAYGTSDPRPTVVCDPPSGSLFPIGVKTVQCKATDSFGNHAEGSFTVTVQDTVAPMIVELAANPDLLKPNMKWVEVTVSVSAVDIVDPAPRCAVVDITTNQPGGGMRVTGEFTVELLAERDPKLGDRVYDIRVECADSSDNTNESFATVVVPKGNPDEGSSEPVTVPTTKKWTGMRGKG